MKIVSINLNDKVQKYNGKEGSIRLAIYQQLTSEYAVIKWANMLLEAFPMSLRRARSGIRGPGSL